MSAAAYTLTNRQLSDLVGSAYGRLHENDHHPEDPLSVACSALESAADELNVLRHALRSDELDVDKLDMVLFRLAERLEVSAAVAWDAHRASLGDEPATAGDDAAAEGPVGS